jgi:hypothetical protein
MIAVLISIVKLNGIQNTPLSVIFERLCGVSHKKQTDISLTEI